MCARGTGHLRRIAQVLPGSNAVTHLRTPENTRHSHDALIARRRFLPRHINHIPTLHAHTAQCSVLRIFRLSSPFVLCSQFWPRHTTHTHTHSHTHTHHSIVTIENKNIYRMKIPESQRVIVKSSDHCYWVLYRDVLIGGP